MDINLYNATGMHDFFLQFLLCIGFLRLIDKFAPTEIIVSRARWFFLHIWINFIVIMFSLRDLKICFATPRLCFSPNQTVCSTIPWAMAMAGHIYHMVAFKKLTWDDYLHHVLMVPIAGLVGFFFMNKPGFNTAIFGLTGLPGGIDYVLLTLVKLGYIPWETEKKLNVIIQTWFRMPLLVFGGGIFYAEYMEGTLSPICLVAFLLTVWNGIFYQHDTLFNYYTKHYNRIHGQTNSTRTKVNTNEEIEI